MTNTYLDSTTGDQFRLPYALEIRPAKEFRPEAGQDRLMDLSLLHGGEDTRLLIPDDIILGDVTGTNNDSFGRQENLLRLSSFLDMRCRLTVRTFLLTLLHQKAHQTSLDVLERSCRICSGNELLGTFLEIPQRITVSELVRLRCSL